MGDRYNRSEPGCKARAANNDQTNPCLWSEAVHPRDRHRPGSLCSLKGTTRCSGVARDGSRCSNCGKFGLVRCKGVIYPACFYHTPLPSCVMEYNTPQKFLPGSPVYSQITRGEGVKWGKGPGVIKGPSRRERRRFQFIPHASALPQAEQLVQGVQGNGAGQINPGAYPAVPKALFFVTCKYLLQADMPDNTAVCKFREKVPGVEANVNAPVWRLAFYTFPDAGVDNPQSINLAAADFKWGPLMRNK